MRIERAWCVELNRDMDIHDAHQSYFKQPEPRKRFKFLCVFPACRQAGVAGSVRLVFYDKLDAKKTVVYLSSDVMDEPGHGAFRRDVIERMDCGAGYAHAYIFGQPRFDESRGQIELIYSDPRHIDLRFKAKPLKQA